MLSTQYFVLKTSQLSWLHILLFLSILTGYTYIFYINRNGKLSDDRTFWYKENEHVIGRLLKIYTALIVLLIAIKFNVLFQTIFLGNLALPLTVIALFVSILFYTNRLFITQNNSVSKIFTLLKPFFLSLIWVLATCIIPILFLGVNASFNSVIKKGAMFHLLAQFVFISILCILFDIKDIKTDATTGLKTIPIVFGISFTKSIFLYPLIIVFGVLSFAANATFFFLLQTVVLAAILGWLVVKKIPNNNTIFYITFVDGLMLLKSLSTLLILQIN